MEIQPPSKTQRKKDMHALQALGERLVALSTDQLARIHIPDPLREAVVEARRVRAREAHRRQLQFIGRLMREMDAASIRDQIDALDGRSREAIAAHHRVERWRKQLLADDAALTDFAREHPSADVQALRTCVRETRKEQLSGKPPRHFRELFQLIKQTVATPAGDASDEGAQ